MTWRAPPFRVPVVDNGLSLHPHHVSFCRRVANVAVGVQYVGAGFVSEPVARHNPSDQASCKASRPLVSCIKSTHLYSIKNEVSKLEHAPLGLRTSFRTKGKAYKRTNSTSTCASLRATPV